MSSRFPKSVEFTTLLLAALLIVSIAMLTAGQPDTVPDPPQGTTRKIVSDDFTKNRKETASGQSPKKATSTQLQDEARSRPRARRTYRLASSTRRTRPLSRTATVTQLGVTIWRLRPARAKDEGTRALVREKGKSWVPERVEADTVFREGDHIRLSVEFPRAGYLYVVDRDLFADGTTGGAMLIYPWSDSDNEVRPGKLVDIPGQEEDPSFFTARLTSANQVGELLTFIVTSTPLDLPISDKPFQISNTQMALWEKMWGRQNERFEMEGGAGETWTKQEQEAAAKKGTRQLTRDDPAPQTIYRMNSKDKTGFLVHVKLRYAK